jgi:hypothetical protein
MEALWHSCKSPLEVHSVKNIVDVRAASALGLRCDVLLRCIRCPLDLSTWNSPSSENFFGRTGALSFAAGFALSYLQTWTEC